MDKLRSMFKGHGVGAVFFYLVAGLVMHLDRFVMGASTVIKTHDQFDSYWPFQLALADRIARIQMPGWLPDFAGGIPFFIWDVNWMFFPVISSALFPDPWNITIITIFQFLLAGFGAYLFLLHFFDADEPVSLLGGLLWAVSTFSLTYWRIFDLAALPMLFYCTDRIAAPSGRKTRLLLIGGLLVCAMNLWFIKGAVFMPLFHFFFILFVPKSWNARKKVFVVYSLVWAFVALLNLPMIVSLLVNATYSSRKLIEWAPQDTSIRDILSSIFWFFFSPVHQSSITLGFTASLMIFFSLLNFRQWSRLTKRLFYYYIATLFFTQFVIYSSWFLSFWTSLPVSGFRLARLVFIGPFVLFIMAMSNMERFLEFLRGPQRKVFLLIFITAAIPVMTQLIRNSFPSNYLEAVVVVFLAVITAISLTVLREKGAGSRAYIILFIVLILSERFVQINLTRVADVRPPSFTHFYKSDLFDRFRPAHKYDYRIAFINWHPVVGLYNRHQVAGGIGQYSQRYYYFWDTLITGKAESRAFHDYYHMAYLLDEGAKKEGSPPKVIREPGFSTDLLALHNVRYIFSFNEIENPGRWGLTLVNRGISPERRPGIGRGVQVFERIFTPIPYYVYEINKCLPRVFTAASYELMDGQESLKAYLRRNGVNKLADRIVYNRDDLSEKTLNLLSLLQRGTPANENPGMAEQSRPRIVSYSDNKIIINVTAPVPRQLVLNENYFRDWTATINGRPAIILPAYGVFRSVILQQGENRVVFEYKPTYLIASLWTSGLGSIFFLLAAFLWASTARGKESDAGAASAVENGRPGRAVEDQRTS